MWMGTLEIYLFPVFRNLIVIFRFLAHMSFTKCRYMTQLFELMGSFNTIR
jgi:hypothetical protein